MAINKNHEFEDLDGIKCAIVEKNASPERVSFLKALLEFNNFKVIVIPSPPPKAVPASAQATAGTPAPKPTEARPDDLVGRGEVDAVAETPPPPSTFTVGVTNVSFNPTNAIFSKLLRTKNGHVVTLPYWYQKESVSHDEIPYYETKL